MSISPSATSSKRDRHLAGVCLRTIGRLATAMLLPAALAAAVPQLVDCVAAEVNSRAITLTDVRILQAFDFEGRRAAGAPAPAPAEILRRAIDRQVVVEMLRESLPISAEEEDIRLKSLKGRFTPAEWQRLLETFGITEDDLRSYMQKFLQYERMIAIRFGRTIDISVKEIQDYYDTEYVPAQKSAALEPKPLVGVLSEIEERLKEKKRESQVSAWIQDLRSQAEIRVHQECLGRLE